MKRSRRVVLTMMGTAALGAVSMPYQAMGLTSERPCGPGNDSVPGPGGRPDCRAIQRGFGGTFHSVHAHGHGHGHAGG